MAVGFPTKANWAAGDVLTASAQDDLAGTLNLLSPAGVTSGYVPTANGSSTSVTWVAQSSGSTYVAGKNGIINGGMDIWQRGTSFTPTVHQYTADRWDCGRFGGVSGAQITQQSSGLTGFQYALRLQRIAANTGTQNIAMITGLESKDSYRFAGQTAVLSFYARAGANYSAASNAFVAQIQYGTGTDESPWAGYTGNVATTSTVTLTSSWQRFSFTAAIGSTCTEIGAQLYYTPVGTAGTNDYVEVTGFQLEIASAATAFARTGGTLQGELAACQRYYFRNTTESTGNYLALGFTATTSTGQFMYPFPVTMRVAPSALEYANCAIFDGVTQSSITGLVVNWTSKNYINIYTAGSTGLTAFRPSLICANGSVAYIGFSAEL
jgi:hypothetical protein